MATTNMEIAIHHQKHPAINKIKPTTTATKKTVNKIIYFALFNNKNKNKLLNNLFIIPAHQPTYFN